MWVTFLQNQINRKSTCNWLKTPTVSQVERKKGGKKIRCSEIRQFKGTEADAKIVAAVSNTVQAVKVVRKISRTKIGGHQNITNSQTTIHIDYSGQNTPETKWQIRNTSMLPYLSHTCTKSAKGYGKECRSLCNSAGTNKTKAKYGSKKRRRY